MAAIGSRQPPLNGGAVEQVGFEVAADEFDADENASAPRVH
jgi:hypothetical protein